MSYRRTPFQRKACGGVFSLHKEFFQDLTQSTSLTELLQTKVSLLYFANAHLKQSVLCLIPSLQDCS